MKLSALGSATFFTHTESARLLAPARRRPNERLRLAVVGCGGMGKSDLDGCMGEEIVALCDVDTKMAEAARAQCKEARFYADWRDLLEAEADLDGVVVSTPDHSHAPIAAAAMRRKLAVRVQKPLTHTVAEARLLASLEREMGVVTQMGNQGTAMDGFREGTEVLRSGAIGDVHTVHVWTNRPIWKQGQPRPDGAEIIPENLRWDLFLGPAPYRPFHSGYHPFHWRGFWDFGTGALGDMACHLMNLAFSGLELGAPDSVRVEAQDAKNDETAPTKSILRYAFPARGKWGPVELVWYDGGHRPPQALLPADTKWSAGGSIFVGSEGVMYVDDDYGARYRLLPDDKFGAYRPPTPFLPRVPMVMGADGKPRPSWQITAEWLAAIRGEGQTSSGFARYAGPFTEAVLLGNVALRAGGELRWDAGAMRVKDRPEADQLLDKRYARGFSVRGTQVVR
ncbi:MAG: Gfo/Idh/MocA family oxidoreductase [Planctomycetota bacterium]